MQAFYTYRPISFFSAVFVGTWIPWSIAVYASYDSALAGIQQFCMVLGLLVPAAMALVMIFGSRNKELITDFWERLCLSKLRSAYLPMLFLLAPMVLFLATAISLFFGGSVEQFALAQQYAVMSGHNVASIVLISLAPLLEELGWRGYGVDSLRAYMNLWRTSLAFALLWGLWHLPLFFIQGYYHHELVAMGALYVLNFFVSLIPFTILINWLYYKNNRSIWAGVIFHLMINLASVLFQTTQTTKCIMTVLLCSVATIVIVWDKQFFFSGKGLYE